VAEQPSTTRRSGGEEDWTVLAILGPSGVGKSIAAQSIALARACTWVQVDDLRLALQASAAIPNDRLSFFDRAPDIWNRSVDELCAAISGIAHLMAPAVRIVIDSHIATNVPMVIEGDGILPALALDPVLRHHVHAGRLRFCCVVPDTVGELLDNMDARGRGIDQLTSGERVKQAEMNIAFSRWLTAACMRCSVPVVHSRPFSTLSHRIISAIERS